MTTFEKIATILLAASLAVSLIGTTLTAVTLANIGHGQATTTSQVTDTTSAPTTSTEPTDTSSSTDTIDVSNYVTYYDLVYAAYTQPDKFLNKEITVVGYYSNSAVAEDTTESVTSEGTVESDTTSESGTEATVYHFITTYGQVDECHITAEFTTSDNKYPEIGEVIQITGTFTSYNENGQTYYTITADGYTTVST